MALDLADIQEKLRSRAVWIGFTAEFLATAIFVFNVVGANLSWNSPNFSVLHIAVTVGFSITVLATSIGHLTGGQINPVVSLSFIATKRIHLIDGILYICGQFLGGILGASIMYGLTPSTIRKSFGIAVPSSQVSVGQAFGMEAFLTFLLVFTIYSVTDSKRPDSGYFGPIIIGICVFVCHMIGIPYTGCSMNPARSFGPAVVTNTWTDQWVYWVGPIIGALVAGFLYEYVFAAKKNKVIPNENGVEL